MLDSLTNNNLDRIFMLIQRSNEKLYVGKNKYSNKCLGVSLFPYTGLTFKTEEDDCGGKHRMFKYYLN